MNIPAITMAAAQQLADDIRACYGNMKSYSVLAEHLLSLGYTRAGTNGDTARLDFLIKYGVRPKRMGDTDLWMLVDTDGHPCDGSEHDTARDAIDSALVRIAQEQTR